MPDTKITDLAIASTLHPDDWLVSVDTHDTNMAASGTDKRLSPSVLAAAMTVSQSQVTGLTTALAGKEPAIAGGTGSQFWRGDKTWAVPAGGGSGTVTTVSVASANGLAGTVASATTTPIITLTTTITGVLKGNGTAISAAAAGTDYLSPSGSGAALTGITESQVTGLVSDLAGKEPTIATTASTNYWRGDKTFVTLNQAAVAGLTTASSPTFAGLTLGSLAGILKASAGVVSAGSTGLTITQWSGAITSDTDGATVTFDLAASNRHTVTLGGNRTLALSGATTGQQFTLILVQDGTGTRTVTWFGGIKWPGGTVPTLTTTAGKADVFTFLCTGAGAYYGFVAGQAL